MSLSPDVDLAAGTRNTHFIFLHLPLLLFLLSLSQLRLQRPSVFRKRILPFNVHLNLLLHPSSRLIHQNLHLSRHLPQLFPCSFMVYPTWSNTTAAAATTTYSELLPPPPPPPPTHSSSYPAPSAPSAPPLDPYSSLSMFNPTAPSHIFNAIISSSTRRWRRVSCSAFPISVALTTRATRISAAATAARSATQL